MRTMVKFTLPTQETNPLVKDGSVGQTMETLLGKLQPEAAYFGPVDGKRGGFIVINMEEESEVVTKLEPLWLELGATVETFPVATADDLRAGLQSLGQTSISQRGGTRAPRQLTGASGPTQGPEALNARSINISNDRSRIAAPPVTYSPECVEGKFLELRKAEVLRISLMDNPLVPHHRLGRPRDGYRVSVQVHDLPGAPFWPEDHRVPQLNRTEDLAPSYLGLLVRQLHHVGQLVCHVLRHDLRAQELAVPQARGGALEGHRHFVPPARNGEEGFGQCHVLAVGKEGLVGLRVAAYELGRSSHLQRSPPGFEPCPFPKDALRASYAIHRSAWKGHSQKFEYNAPMNDAGRGNTQHSPASISTLKKLAFQPPAAEGSVTTSETSLR